MKKRIVSLVAVLVLLWTMMPASTYAATTSGYAPYAEIETGYSPDVQCGTIRYISQITGSGYFNSNYWGEWERQASSECGTACISIALSYIGVNRTPKNILDAGNGLTYFGWNWGEGVVKTYTADNLSAAVDNYINGGGKYSPPIIHLNQYSTYGHYVVIVGQISSNTYQVMDPGNSVVTWNMTIDGTVATYIHPRYGTEVIDSIEILTRNDDIYQYYNANASISTGSLPAYSVSFNANGGAFAQAIASAAIDGVNIDRPEQALVVYNDQAASPNTNPFGTEVAVNSEGLIEAVRLYGEENQLEIPSGGFVLSGHSCWENDVEVGGSVFVDHLLSIYGENPRHTYVSVDYETGEVKVFDSRDAYLAEGKQITEGDAMGELPTPDFEGMTFAGWYTAPYGGTQVTDATTVYEDLSVYARYSYDGVKIDYELGGGSFPEAVAADSIHGVNMPRHENALVVFNENVASRYTNGDGAAVAVNADGLVVAQRRYGDENQLEIPGGGFVLTGDPFAEEIISICDSNPRHTYVSLDYETGEVKVFDSYDGYLAETKRVALGDVMGALPMPTRGERAFIGWFTEASGGSAVTEDSVFSGGTLYARWAEAEAPVKPGITAGDVNGDHKVNGLDLVLLRQYLTGWDAASSLKAADCNGDGKVNGLDLILLRQYLAGWDVTLGRNNI